METSEFIALTGRFFALAVIDKTVRVFEDVAISAIPENLRFTHNEINEKLKDYRTALIQELNEYRL